MRKILVILITVMVVLCPSCRSKKDATKGLTYTHSSGSKSKNASKTPWTEITSDNVAEMEISKNGISYTIDISTPEGQLKLKGIKQEDAEELALTEAVIANNCAMLINPQYTFLKEGKDMLRVTVYGFPAYYTKIRPKAEVIDSEPEEVEVEETITTKTTTKKPVRKNKKKKR